MKQRLFACLGYVTGLSIACAVLFLPGCGTTSGTVFKVEKTSVDGVHAAFQGWLSYYKAATNGASANKRRAFGEEANLVNRDLRDFGLSVQVAEALRVNYEKSRGTNPAALDELNAAVKAVNLSAPKIINLIWHFRTNSP